MHAAPPPPFGFMLDFPIICTGDGGDGPSDGRFPERNTHSVPVMVVMAVIAPVMVMVERTGPTISSR